VLRDGADDEEAKETRAVLAHVLETSLRLMHPLMPFLTEELWQRAPRPASRRRSIAFGPYPTVNDDARPDEAAIRDMEIFKAVVTAARTIRSEHEIERRADVPLAIRSDSETARAMLADRLGAIAFLVGSKAPAIEKTGGGRAAGTTVSVVPSPQGPIEVLVGLKGLVKKEEELARIDRELKKIEKDLAAIDKKLGSKGFVDRAPKEVVDEANAQKQQLLDARTRLAEAKTLADEL
jgi:valyl-tRNA synthetase